MITSNMIELWANVLYTALKDNDLTTIPTLKILQELIFCHDTTDWEEILTVDTIVTPVPRNGENNLMLLYRFIESFADNESKTHIINHGIVSQNKYYHLNKRRYTEVVAFCRQAYQKRSLWENGKYEGFAEAVMAFFLYKIANNRLSLLTGAPTETNILKHNSISYTIGVFGENNTHTLCQRIEHLKMVKGGHTSLAFELKALSLIIKIQDFEVKMICKELNALGFKFDSKQVNNKLSTLKNYTAKEKKKIDTIKQAYS